MTKILLDFLPFIISTSIFWRVETVKYFSISAKNTKCAGTILSDYTAVETAPLLYIPVHDVRPQKMELENDVTSCLS